MRMCAAGGCAGAPAEKVGGPDTRLLGPCAMRRCGFRGDRGGEGGIYTRTGWGVREAALGPGRCSAGAARVKLGTPGAGLGSRELRKGRGASPGGGQSGRSPSRQPRPRVQAELRCLGDRAGEAGWALAPRCWWSRLRPGAPPSQVRKAAQVLLLGADGLF